jgi:hypothetical protein
MKTMKLMCNDCEKWYGAEDDEYGPCSIKHARGDKKFITYGYHECDEHDELNHLEKLKM